VSVERECEFILKNPVEGFNRSAIDLVNVPAQTADRMMMMLLTQAGDIRGFARRFVATRDHAHGFQQIQRPIDRRKGNTNADGR
jgi:hypothetical protein